MGNYGASPTLIDWGGYFGLAAAVFAFYLALAGLLAATFGRVILPVFPWIW
jgi:succinate-acetate transporter protein